MRALIIGTMLLASSAALAQTPYAGMQSRPIKALSEQQVVDPGAGRGMGLALAAELNGYPGPSHVLELADKLELTADQRASVQSLFDSMKARYRQPRPTQGTPMTDREKIIIALREKPLKAFEIMKRVNIKNRDDCQSLLLKMRDDGAVKFDIYKGHWLTA
jgi:hypothetical protein